MSDGPFTLEEIERWIKAQKVEARDPQFGVRRRQVMRGLFREGDDDAEEMHVIGERSCALCRGHGRVCGVRCSWCGGSGLTCDSERG